MGEADNKKDRGYGGVKMELDGLPDEISTHTFVDNMFAILAILFIGCYILVFFIGYGIFVNAVVGATSLLVALISFLYTFHLYGWKSQEGKVWMILSISLLILLAANINSLLGRTYMYYLLRFITIPVFSIALLLKIKFAGLDLDLSQKTVTGILAVGWSFLVFVSAVLPASGGGFELTEDTYAIYAFTEIFAFLLAMIIIQMVRTKGWFFISLGLVLISMGDIFYPLAQEYGLIYPGTPLRLLWYLGLLLSAYGAYHQRREHLKMIAI